MDIKFITAITAIFVAGCSGGGGSDTSTPTGNTGVFIDSAVSGINYQTETKSGSTNTAGEFSFLPNENVTFSIGDVNLPATPAGTTITPLDVFNAQSVNDTSVVNAARLLQTLDEDGDPTNGISITATAHASATGLTLDFSSPTFDSDVANLVANSGSVTTSLIDEATAISHLQDSLADSGLLTLVGSWYNTDGHEMIITFVDESNYFVTMDIDEVAEPACSDGMESGTYSWDSATGGFSLTNVIDTTGSCGLSSTPGETYTTSASIAGNTLTIVDALEGVADAYSKVIDSTNPIIGSWYIDESNTGGNKTLVTFIDNLNYFVTQKVSPDELVAIPPSSHGMESGTYTYDSATGDIMFTNVIDTTGDSGFTGMQGDTWGDVGDEVTIEVGNGQLTFTYVAEGGGSFTLDAIR